MGDSLELFEELKDMELGVLIQVEKFECEKELKLKVLVFVFV